MEFWLGDFSVVTGKS